MMDSKLTNKQKLNGADETLDPAEIQDYHDNFLKIQKFAGEVRNKEHTKILQADVIEHMKQSGKLDMGDAPAEDDPEGGCHGTKLKLEAASDPMNVFYRKQAKR